MAKPKFEDTLVTLIGRTQTVQQWAAERRLNMLTVKSRWQKRNDWESALAPLQTRQQRTRAFDRKRA